MSRTYLTVELARDCVQTGVVVVALPGSWSKEQCQTWLRGHVSEIEDTTGCWELDDWRGETTVEHSSPAGPTEAPDLVVDNEGACRAATAEDRRAPNPPPDDAWIMVDGHRWATDGAVLIREDGPRPGRVVDWLCGERRLAAYRIVAILACQREALLARTGTVQHGDRTYGTWEAGSLVLHLDEDYVAQGLELWTTTGGPPSLVVGLRGGECVLAVGPVRLC